MFCGYVLLLKSLTTLVSLTYQYNHLPQQVSLRSWTPRFWWYIPPLDATGGWQVAAGRGGPWWW